jgi:hypothetical protein
MMTYRVHDTDGVVTTYHGFSPLVTGRVDTPEPGDLVVLVFSEGDIDGVWHLDRPSAINELRSYYEARELDFHFVYLKVSDWR